MNEKLLIDHLARCYYLITSEWGIQEPNKIKKFIEDIESIDDSSYVQSKQSERIEFIKDKYK